MASSGSTRARGGFSVRRGLIGIILTLFMLQTIVVAWRAAQEAFFNDDFPELLAIKLEALPVVFPVHMITGAAALLLVPLTYALRRKRWHRRIGVLTATVVMVAAITAYPVAWVEPVTVWSGAAFIAQTTLWLSFLAQGLWAIRRRNGKLHRRYMLLMLAITFGAVFFRLLLGLWAAVGDIRNYHLAYSLIAWLGWGVPLTVMHFMTKQAGPSGTLPR